MSSVCLPMESNPDTMSKYLYKMGVPNKWRIVDVIGLDNDALAWVPRPVLAVILLFPLSDAYEKDRRNQEMELMSKGHTPPEDVFHLKQVLSNVCGTIALVHSIANNVNKIELHDGLLKKYIEEAKSLDASAKGVLLENSKAILESYKDLVSTGGEETGTVEEEISNHFVTFIHKNGTLFELDGRKQFPISHGPTTPDSLLEDAAKICRKFIEKEPDQIGFNVVALVQAS